MDELVKMLLEGKSDRQILSRIHELENSLSVTENIKEPNDEYISCVNVDGRPILPPVLDDPARSECHSWKEEAIQKENLIKYKGMKIKEPDEYIYSQTDMENESTLSSLPNSVISESDHEPRSFSEIKKLMKTKKSHLSLPTPRSLVSSISRASTPNCLSLSISDDSRPSSNSMTPIEYKPNLYSDGEDDAQVRRYDSNLSVNTVIEKTPRQPLNQDEGSKHATNNENSDNNKLITFVDNDVTNHTPNTNTEDSETIFPLRRHGSYLLDKPSPLLQAHLDKFGNEDDTSCHDMSLTQRILSHDEQTLDQQQQHYPNYFIDEVLLSELENFSMNPVVSNVNTLVTSPVPALSQISNTYVDPQSYVDNQHTEQMDSIISTTSEDMSSTQEDKPKNDVGDTNDLLINNNNDSAPPPSLTYAQNPTPVEPEILEKKVQELADDYMLDLKLLLKKQEQERINLRLQFEHKQKELVEQILQQFPNLSTDKENISPESEQNNDRNITAISLNQSIPSAESQNVHIPEAAYLPKYVQGWSKLTALARGFLVRRLVKTEKVEDLKRTIRDTVACAVKLHKDTGNGQPSSEELSLHNRLLVQLESACASIHKIFFQLGIPERMSIIALDREARNRKAKRPLIHQKEKFITAATKTRIEKQKLSTVEKGRQVLTKLHQNSPYKPPVKSPSKSRVKVVANTKNVDVKLIKTESKTQKNISTVSFTNKEAKMNVADGKRNVTFKNTSRKPAWK